jgi:hypothetical protein
MSAPKHISQLGSRCEHELFDIATGTFSYGYSEVYDQSYLATEDGGLLVTGTPQEILAGIREWTDDEPAHAARLAAGRLCCG